MSSNNHKVYDHNKATLKEKTSYFCHFYNEEVQRWKLSDKTIPVGDFINRTIKWTEELEGSLIKGNKLNFDISKIKSSSFRPFIKKNLYYDKTIIHRLYKQDIFYPTDQSWSNTSICFRCISSDDLITALSTNVVSDLAYLKTGNGGTFSIPYFFHKGDQVFENVTDLGLQQFQSNYKNKKITKEEIFHYTYAVLHDPWYKNRYELNLKREFPRLPFYDDFKKWSTCGKKLMDLHINYEEAKPFALKEITHKDKAEHKKEMKKLFEKAEEPEVLYGRKPKIKAKLKANKEEGVIEIDELTVLTGVPKEAWDYKLGNRSALEWVLDQYKEKKPSDTTIAEKFNTYRFADYKEHVIDLLKKVCTVSVETMKIVREMQEISPK
jgi:predicted helicase